MQVLSTAAVFGAESVQAVLLLLMKMPAAAATVQYT
jgi:hypothetical protein